MDYVKFTYPGGPQAAESSQAVVADSLGTGNPPPRQARPHAPAGACLVQPGDSLSMIAGRLMTSADQLLGQNGIPNAGLVYGSQTLLLFAVEHLRVRASRAHAR